MLACARGRWVTSNEKKNAHTHGIYKHTYVHTHVNT